MLASPCKDCTDRKLNCHSVCEKYIDFRKKKDEANEIRRKAKHLEDDYWDFRQKYKDRWKM